jgi:hypothetical protein
MAVPLGTSTVSLRDRFSHYSHRFLAKKRREPSTINNDKNHFACRPRADISAITKRAKSIILKDAIVDAPVSRNRSQQT